MKIISERHVVTDNWYELDFFTSNTNELCAGFPCDENGNVQFDKMQQCGIDHYNNKIKDNRFYSKVKLYKHSYTQAAIGICNVCGKEVELVNSYCGATDCECGQWYNISGQEIKPPDLWEESIDYDY